MNNSIKNKVADNIKNNIKKYIIIVIIPVLVLTSGMNYSAGTFAFKTDMLLDTNFGNQYNDETTEITNGTSVEQLELYAKYACLMDAKSGRILYGRDETTPAPNASTTKIMTCILALEYGNLDDMVGVSEYAASMPDVQLGMTPGEYYKLGDLLYSLMLESHNDTAVAIAEHISGSVEAFALLMNQKARDLGCTNTYFITPNGLDAKDEKGEHSISAADLCTIMSYCILKSAKREDFLNITRTNSYSFNNMKKQDNGDYVNGSRTFSCSNHNSFLTMMDGALSGKTGFTGNAGYCYVGALENGDNTYVVALLACGWPNNKNYKWSDTKKLMKYGMETFRYVKFSDYAITVNDITKTKIIGAKTDTIDDGINAEIEIVSNGGNNGLLMCDDETIEKRYDVDTEIIAPVKNGDIIGTIKYNVNGITYKTDSVVVTKDYEAIDIKWCFEKILDIFLI